MVLKILDVIKGCWYHWWNKIALLQTQEKEFPFSCFQDQNTSDNWAYILIHKFKYTYICIYVYVISATCRRFINLFFNLLMKGWTESRSVVQHAMALESVPPLVRGKQRREEICSFRFVYILVWSYCGGLMWVWMKLTTFIPWNTQCVQQRKLGEKKVSTIFLLNLLYMLFCF